MKALSKKPAGIYIPGYQYATTKKPATAYYELMLDVLDTDEDRIMYRYNDSVYAPKTRQQAKDQNRHHRH